MDNAKSKPMQALEEKDLLVLVEYLDLTYRWVEYFKHEALDSMVKLVDGNKSFNKWLKDFVFDDNYRLFVGKEFKFDPASEEGQKKVPKVGSIVERSKNKSHNWTKEREAAVKFSEILHGKLTPKKYNGGLIAKHPSKVGADNIINDVYNLYDFFATDDRHGPEVYHDIQRLGQTTDGGTKLISAMNRLYNASKKINLEKEVIARSNINIYEVIGTWVVDHDKLEITTDGDWGVNQEA